MRCHVFCGLALSAASLLSAQASAATSQESSTELALQGIATVAPAIAMPQRSAVFANAAATIVNHRDVKGEFGEALARSHRVLGLQGGGRYVSVPPRTGRQGIDVLLIGVNSKGQPNGKVLVVESKFSKGPPKLGNPDDGFQGSAPWVDARLRRIAEEYGLVARATGDVARTDGPRPKGAVSVTLPSGKRGWVAVDGRRIQTNLSEQEFRAAQEWCGASSKAIRDVLRSGKAESVVMWVRPVRDGYRVTVSDISRYLEPKTVPKFESLPQRHTIFLKAENFLAAEASIDAIAKELQAKSPHLDRSTSRAIARQVFDDGKAFHETVEMSRRQQWYATLRMAALGSAVPVALAVGAGLIDLIRGEQVDWTALARVAGQGGASAALGTGTGIVVSSIAVEQPALGRALAAVGRSVGLNPLPSYRIAGGVAGGAVASIALAGLMYWSGDVDGTDALVLSGVGVGSTLVVAGAELATLTAVAAYATASSGTAISSLSGAAAANATAAWLGGGAVSAGGFGAAGGAIVLTAGGAVIAIAAGWAFIALYETWDGHRELSTLQRRLEYLRSDWDRALNETPAMKAALFR